VADLKANLPNAFIYFLPRDIVSGDFYYIDQCGDKLIVACVDCTGHGVPGGFMSMIGSVTLRNIYNANHARGIWQTPELVLEALDTEIEHILKQNVIHEDELNEFYKSRDGMDMTLIEVDLKTNEVLLASAMRTSLMFTNGQLEVIPGTKRPIGGGDTLTMPFELKKFQFKKGEGLYLFSDGYTDQFGGPTGRKLKLSGVKEIVLELQNHPNSKREHLIKETFENWLSDYPQIDDVLFMGIEF
jgi:serine phosphatase RsbU (regulator of sigma subunit)